MRRAAKRAKAPPRALDCQACGACCCNSAVNKSERFIDYVEVLPRDALSKRPQLVKHLCVVNAIGETHLKLIGREQRCIALGGDVGVQVSCNIYDVRPRPCRAVQPGSDECLERRKDQGLD